MPRKTKNSCSNEHAEKEDDNGEDFDVTVVNLEGAGSLPSQQPSSNDIDQKIGSILSAMNTFHMALAEIKNENKRNMDELRLQINAANTTIASPIPVATSPYVLPTTIIQTQAKSPPSQEHTHVQSAIEMQTHTKLTPPLPLPAQFERTVQMQKQAQTPPFANAPPSQTAFGRRDDVVQMQPQLMHTSYNAGLYDLPRFDGKAEEWPLFKRCYVDTTAEFHYNNRQNLMRLHKALQGAAKSAVSALLIYPDDVPKAIQELEFNFGRPDLLVRAQLNKIQELPAMSEGHLELVLNLSNLVRNMVALFKSAGCEHHLLNSTLVEQLVNKLPQSKQYEWAKYAARIPSFPTVEDFAAWIAELAKVVSMMLTNTATTPRPNQSSSASSRNHLSVSRRVLHSDSVVVQKSTTACAQCNQSHSIADCKDFAALAIDDKWNQVKKLHLCFGCLKNGHSLSNCRKRRSCAIDGYSKMHYRLLHNQLGESNVKLSPILNCRVSDDTVQWFKIVPVVLSGPSGNISVFAMLDEGSSVSLIDEDVSKVLGLQGRVSPLTLQWYGKAQKTESSRKVTVEIKGSYKSAPTFTLKNICTIANLDLPAQTLRTGKYSHMDALPIMEYKRAQPKILLGLDYAFLGVYKEVIEGGQHQPIAVRTKLGWIAFGPNGQDLQEVPTVLHIRESRSLREINNLVNEYFSTDNFGVRSTNIVLESDENRRAKKILEDTTKKIGDRYETGLLWRSDEIILPQSYEMAKQRLLKVERRMLNDPVYAERYKAEIGKYLERGYARALTVEEAKVQGNRTWYLPHFGVLNPNKPAKLRIVFDAAAVSCNVCLNTVLLKGPEHAKPLLTILFQFRQGTIAVAGDIREMFSQIRIRKADQSSQRFLWREGNQSQPIKVYEMASMIFGAICSPCCAEYIRKRNASYYMQTKPHGAAIVTDKTYVDDLVVSFNDKDDVEGIIKEAIEINTKAGFTLRNFVSNCREIQSKLNGNESNDNTVFNMERRNVTDKVLGLFWNTEDDTLQYHFKFHKIPRDVLKMIRPPTKRELLGIIMAVFDLFGLLSNYTICSKLLLQATWKLNIDWNEPLPAQLYVQWKGWWRKFQEVKDFTVPRCYSPILFEADYVQLHVFTDASSNAYAAVAYLRVKHAEQINIVLVAAKSRCAPPKGMTIPRLELQAAVLGCRLSETIQDCLEVKIHHVIFWCDSKTVIQWIRSTTRKYKQFVACRVAEILSTSTPNQWKWLPTEMNVADEATRAKLPASVENDARWVRGPEFLMYKEERWPQENERIINEYTAEDIVVSCMLVKVTKEAINYSKYSSYIRAVRVTAWVFRFIKNTQQSNVSDRNTGELTASDISYAELIVCRQVQNECFTEEITALISKKYVSKSSNLYQLTPFVDNGGILRLRGRIDAAYCLPVSARNPIIMPRDHHVTRLIVDHYHRKRHHMNDYLVINEIRQKFWVLSIRSVLKTVRSNCLICLTLRAKPRNPLMGQLPLDRLTPYLRPFSYCGVDYCGPFHIAVGRRREKKWVALFTCLTTRAIHVEIADDLSTDSFMLCLRNFMNRRGTPVRIRSDNGTNFIGAQKELTKENRVFDLDRIQQNLSTENIEWIFNVPGNPHAGGCWERLVQCVKRLLSQVFKEQAPRLETFRSALIEAENIINSRPLTDIPTSPEQQEPLTPNHFLLGCLNSTQTPCDDLENVCLRKQWKLAQNLKDRLWKRWVVEYLPRLLRRSKWRQETPPLNPGQLVIICDPSQPRGQWLKGRITKTFAAKDGQVRSAEVMTRNGLVRRPSARLAALEFCESFPQNDSRGAGDVAKNDNAVEVAVPSSNPKVAAPPLTPIEHQSTQLSSDKTRQKTK